MAFVYPILTDQEIGNLQIANKADFLNIEIIKLIRKFNTISLQNLSTENLLSRFDEKFVFSILHLPAFLKAMQGEYSVLEISNQRMLPYRTVYYDSQEFDLYKHHHNGKKNRLKIRQRTYEVSDAHFFEIKIKNNKGKTSKIRLPLTDKNWKNNQDAITLLEHNTNLKAQDLYPVIDIFYRRITLVNKALNERLTIDLELEANSGNSNFEFKNICIVEIKQNEINRLSPPMLFLRNNGIRPYSISKYCIGLAATNASLKGNAFKEKISNLIKLIENGLDSLA